MVLGEDYPDYIGHFRAGTTRSYQEHGEVFMREVAAALKPAAFAAVARALKPGGYFLIFDEAYPETDEAMQTMPIRFAALAQWYELTWGNVVDNATTLRARCQEAGLELAEETSFSRFTIMVAKR
jgi:predicted methyltransferase